MEKMGQLYKINYRDFGGTALKTEKHYYIFRSSATLKKWVKVTEPGKSIQSGMHKGLTRKHGKHNTQNELHIKQ